MSGSAGHELTKIERIEFTGGALEEMRDLEGVAWFALRAACAQWSPRAWLLPAHKPEAASGTPSASP